VNWLGYVRCVEQYYDICTYSVDLVNRTPPPDRNLYVEFHLSVAYMYMLMVHHQIYHATLRTLPPYNKRLSIGRLKEILSTVRLQPKMKELIEELCRPIRLNSFIYYPDCTDAQWVVERTQTQVIGTTNIVGAAPIFGVAGNVHPEYAVFYFRPIVNQRIIGSFGHTGLVTPELATLEPADMFVCDIAQNWFRTGLDDGKRFNASLALGICEVSNIESWPLDNKFNLPPIVGADHRAVLEQIGLPKGALVMLASSRRYVYLIDATIVEHSQPQSRSSRRKSKPKKVEVKE